MSENESENSSPELGSNPNTIQGEEQNNIQQQTPVLNDDQNPDDQQISGEQLDPEDENVPEEIKEETKKLGKGEPDAFYKISEEEYDKIKKCVPENLQRAVVNSKIENGAPPQLWLPVINNVAFGLIAFVPGLNIAYAAVLYANLKILPMWPKKKVKDYTKYNTIGNESKKIENPSSVPPSSFGTRDENNGKQNFGSRNEDDKERQSFGTKDDGSNVRQNFGTKDDGNEKQNFGSRNDNEKQSFGTKDSNSNEKQNFGLRNEDDKERQSFGTKKDDSEHQSFGTKDDGNGKQNFGTKKITGSPSTSFGTKSVNNASMNFGTADTNSVLNSLTKVKQSFGTSKASSSPTTHVDNLNNKTKTKTSFGIGES